ncbi:hypothetical protein M408DRAFT_331089 [Serendipita vermifera MAFF 305830]|uniref:DUF1764-domain-containing protein n=1 Tax=Serendipita vermifera MAFF 305830 TaxID=933852 RepID=A0A0C3AZX0_SERVB|nr:hypothetical protein M408DRAFT_331089 [Serendipita vermifera MAFF 305830]
MPASEIDDIFAGKSTAKKVQTNDSKVEVPTKKKKKSKKPIETESAPEVPSKKKNKTKDAPKEETAPISKKRKRTPPQEVVDSSLPVKRRKSEQTSTASSKKKSDIQKFKDSRGSSGRKRTEEGFVIYTEEELGLNKEGGDTPLCPFDCECCY